MYAKTSFLIIASFRIKDKSLIIKTCFGNQNSVHLRHEYNALPLPFSNDCHFMINYLFIIIIRSALKSISCFSYYENSWSLVSPVIFMYLKHLPHWPWPCYNFEWRIKMVSFSNYSRQGTILLGRTENWPSIYTKKVGTKVGSINAQRHRVGGGWNCRLGKGYLRYTQRTGLGTTA